jgi:hypothetical protein
MAGTGVGSEYAITSNTATTLTYSAQSFTPDTTTRYQIMSTYGIATSGTTTTLVDTTKNWPVNSHAGKRLVYTSGTGSRVEVNITSNSATTLTFALTTAPDTTTMYTILSPAQRGNPCHVVWLHTMEDNVSKSGNYLAMPRGTSTASQIDFYDIAKDWWDNSAVFSPMSEPFSTGTWFAYDGGRYIYMATSPNVGTFTAVYKMDINTRRVTGMGQMPIVTSSNSGGRWLTVVTSPDGGQFLFIALSSTTLFYKALLPPF